MELLSSINSIKKTLFQEYLSNQEISYYNQLPNFKKDNWLIGRFNIKKLIRLYYLKNFQTEVSLQKIKIINKKLQKPIYQVPIKQKHQTSISLSHCDGHALAAISDMTVGVDIEKIRNFKYNTVKSFLTPKELYTLKKQPISNQPKLTTLFWSIKEAYLKALGHGLTYHPQFIEIHLNNKQNIGRIYNKGKNALTKLQWSSFLNNYLCVKVWIQKK